MHRRASINPLFENRIADNDPRSSSRNAHVVIPDEPKARSGI
jgi:hypothetical protein